MVTIDLAVTPWFLVDKVPVPPGTRYLLLDIQLELPWSETGVYEHSKLYWASTESPEFDEIRVVCVHVHSAARRETVAVVLPPAIAGTVVRFRLDPAPTATNGRASLFQISFASSSPTTSDDPRLRLADLESLKDTVRKRGHAAEAESAEVVELPQSISVELTARCNLTCTHCSSHGTDELHQRHNRMPEMAVSALERLADETFPGATTVGLVGRGEPLLVTDRLWAALCAKLRQHGTRMTVVTNGTMTARRLTADVMPLIETVHFSVDGGDAATMGENRGGVSLDDVLGAICEFDRLRRVATLARRPRLGVSWTLKRNNVEQLPAFVERVAKFDLDQLTVRHLLIFHAHNRHESLIGRPDLVNDSLRRTYELLERHGIRSDCPPLMSDASSIESFPPMSTLSTATPVTVSRRERRDGCMFVHRTAVVHADGVVPTCTAPFAARAGQLSERTRFAEVWNGDVLRSIRATLDTADEWQQCRSCWYREGRYKTQRQQFDSKSTRFNLAVAGDFTEESWDFQRYTQD